MAFAETAKLIASLSLQGNFAKNIGTASKSLGAFDSKLDRTQGRAYRAGQQIGTGIKNGARIAAVGIGLLASQVGLGLRSLVELEQQQAQTAAVLKSTGGAAGITGAKVTQLAEKFESLNATIGDEFIRAGENMLLTFRNIKGKAFEPTLAAVLDLNTAMGKGPEGLSKTALQVGKALNDPTKGLTALTRVGVTFTAEQVKRIKGLQKEGKLYEAQQVILKELNKEFGGSFAAQGNTTAGKVAKFTDSIEDLQRALAEALLPTIGNIADELSSFLQDPQVVQGVRDLGKDIAGLFSKDNLRAGAAVLGDFLRAAKDAAPAIAAAAGAAGRIIGTAVKLFNSLPPEIQALAASGLAINKLTGGLVTNIAGGLIQAVLKSFAGAMNVNAGVVNVNGLAGGAGGLPGAAGGKSGGPGLLKLGAQIVLPVAAGILIANAIRELAGITPREAEEQNSRGQFGPRTGGQRRTSAPPRPGRATVAGGGAHTAAVVGALTQKLARLSERAANGNEKAARKIGEVKAEIVRLQGITKQKEKEGKADPRLAQQDAPRLARFLALQKQNKPDKETQRAIEKSERSASRGLDKVTTKVGSLDPKLSAVERAQDAARVGLTGRLAMNSSNAARDSTYTVGAVNRSAVAIASAVRASQPIVTTTVNVTVTAATVTKSVTTQTRHGPGNGSAGGGGGGQFHGPGAGV